MGYDISDYKAIDERYGTLEDWDGLVADLHGRGMKLMYVSLILSHPLAYFKPSPHVHNSDAVSTGWISSLITHQIKWVTSALISSLRLMNLSPMTPARVVSRLSVLETR